MLLKDLHLMNSLLNQECQYSFHFNFELDPNYGKFWVEDTDLSMQSLNLNKVNLRINSKKYLNHQWGGSGKNYQELFAINWKYFVEKWRGKVLTHIK